MKTVSQLDAAGYFVGTTIADESPLEPGVYLIPAGAVDSLPPTIPDGRLAKWNGAWVLEDIPVPSPEPPAPEPPAPGPPMKVTRRQARQAILLSGKLDLVQPAIDAIPDATQRGMMQIEWDDSQEFERNRPSLIAIGGAIGLDAAGIDALFVQAAAL
jgi:hypothetical protein